MNKSCVEKHKIIVCTIFQCKNIFLKLSAKRNINFIFFKSCELIILLNIALNKTHLIFIMAKKFD